MYMYAWGGMFEEKIIENLKVVSAGYFTVNDVDASVTRPKGRNDYQIIFIKHGKAIFLIDGKETIVTENTLLFYHPNEPQIYRYNKIDKTEVLWVHFGGLEAENLLEKLNLSNNKTVKIKNGYAIENKIRSIVDELNSKKRYYEIETLNLLNSILIDISRNSSNDFVSAKNKSINRALSDIHDHYSSEKTVAEYAADCGLSVPHFIRVFKKATGKSPIQYLSNYRLYIAKGLLSTTDYSISYISQHVGFKDSLYFSKCFKKHENCTPSEFRQKTK